MKITKDITIGKILKSKKGAQTVLSGFGLHCFSCPCAQAETLEEACQVHEIDINLVLEKLNELK